MLKDIQEYEMQWKNLGRFNDKTVINSMIAMFMVKKPLMISGKTGTGKSMFAKHIADTMKMTYRHFGDDVESASRSLVSKPRIPALVIVEDIRKQQYTKLIDIYKNSRRNQLCVIDNKGSGWDKHPVTLPEPTKDELYAYAWDLNNYCQCELEEKDIEIVVSRSKVFRDIKINTILYLSGYPFTLETEHTEIARVNSPLFDIKLEGYYMTDIYIS